MNTVRIFVVVGDKPISDEYETCPECGFDAVIRLPVWGLSEHGVSAWGAARVCGRCYDDEGDEDDDDS